MHDRLTDLQVLLSRYNPWDEVEDSALQRMRGLCEVAASASPGDPFARDHFDPGHFTASAFIVSPDAEALLLIMHAKLGRWLQPGGHVEPGDATVRAAAEREVSEEVGLLGLAPFAPGVFDLDIHDIPPLKGEPGHAHFDVRFAFRAPSRSFAAATDALAGRWVSWRELDEANLDMSVMRAVAKLEALR